MSVAWLASGGDGLAILNLCYEHVAHLVVPDV